ncbi:MAG: hypothetical protein WKF43_05020 [Acidimicrobiales bacterium]
MTDPAADDELVSAVLDGQGSPVERARVDADPVLRDRLAEFQAVSDLLGSAADTPPAEDLDRTRAAALDAALAPVTGDKSPSPPVQLAARRRRRTRRVALPPPAVAAAVVLVLAVVGLALVISGGSGQDSARDASTAASAPSAGARTQPESASNLPQARTEDSPARSASLGRFADRTELTRALAGLDPSTLSTSADTALTTTRPSEAAGTVPSPSSDSTTAPDGSGGVPPSTGSAVRRLVIDRCDQVIRAVPGQELGPRTAVAGAVLDRRPVLVYSHPQGGDAATKAGAQIRLLSVVDEETCRILFAVQRE